MNNIPIVINGVINPIFAKANSFILKKYNVSDYDTLKTLWYNEFGASLKGKNYWQYICFDDPKKQVLFSIKFE